jgi:hypothetical protein
MEEEFFEILTIGEQAEIIKHLAEPYKLEKKVGIYAKTLGQAIKRAEIKYDIANKFSEIKNYSKVRGNKQTNANTDEKETSNKKKASSMDIDELISQKLKSAISIDELSSKKLESSISIDELSSQKLISAINIDELSSQKLVNATNVDRESISQLSKGIDELKEILTNNKYQGGSNSGKEPKDVRVALENLPKTIETIERSFRINLDVAENFDKFYEENKGFRVQDLISLALQELIDKYK